MSLPASNPLRLLILEDSPHDAELAVATLEEAGYACQWDRVDTREAFLARLQVPAYDLILADYSLPAFDGLTALRLFRQRDLDIPFILVSGTLGEEIAIESLKAGATDYVLKSRLARLVPVVQRALQEQEAHQQRKQAEAALKASDARFRALIENATDLVSILSADGTIRYVSPSHERIIGYKPEELLGGKTFALEHPEDQGRLREQFARLLKRPGGTERVEFRYKHRDGSWLIFEGIATNLLDDPAVRGLVVNSRDITERKRAEDALRQSEERFRALIENSSDLIAVLTADGVLRYTSPSHERVLGYDAGELIGKNAFELVHPDDAKAVRRLFTAGVGRAGSIGSTEFRFRAKDGSWRVFEGIGKTMRDDPVIGGMVVNSRDITERKRAEEEHARLSAAVEQAAEMVLVTDPDGTIVYANPAFEQQTGYSRAEALGRDPSILKSGCHEAEFFAEMWRTLKRGAVWAGYMINRRKDGSLYETKAVISPVRDAGGQVINYIELSRDVTRERQMEEELRRLNAELEQRVRERTAQFEAANKELEAFSYSVSHDLRAPLRAIEGFSKVLQEDYSAVLDAPGQQHLERVVAATNRMGQLIDDLLGLARVTRSEMHWQDVDLSALAQHIATELQKTQPQRRAEFVIAPGLVGRGDAPLLRVALENLIGNAWKYTSKRAAARIEFGAIDEVSGVGGQRSGQESGVQPPASSEIVYFVRDNGAGFDMAYAAKLFGAFQRLHSATEFEGTGIGLATVQRIIRRHGGRIWAEGSVERGASFYFTLPQ